MEEVITFLEDFIGEEYKTIIALHTESSDDIFEAKRSKLDSHFAMGLDSELYRSSSKNLNDLDKTLRTFQSRILFQVKRYDYPVFHGLYRAYMSSTWRGSNSYFTNFFIGNIDSNLRIVAQYNICNDCNGTGWQNDVYCEECCGFGWNWRGGLKLEALDKPCEVLKIQPPADPIHLKDYESE